MQHCPRTGYPTFAVNAAVYIEEFLDRDHEAGPDGLVNNGTEAKGSAILRAGKGREEGIGGAEDEGTIGGKKSSMCCMGESGLPGGYVCGIAIQICGPLEREVGVEGWET